MAGIRDNPAVPPEVRQQAQVELSSGVPFLADADAEAALEQTGVDGKTAAAIVDENATARLGALAAALNRTAIVAAAALFMAGTIPARQSRAQATDAERGAPDLDRGPGLKRAYPLALRGTSGAAAGR